ncbi:MAG: hypothetical protein CL484_14770 [Acidobacteria bacterium]|nr:hypothetical protein [Acidobacteriota bacterium]
MKRKGVVVVKCKGTRTHTQIGRDGIVNTPVTCHFDWFNHHHGRVGDTRRLPRCRRRRGHGGPTAFVGSIVIVPGTRLGTYEALLALVVTVAIAFVTTTRFVHGTTVVVVFVLVDHKRPALKDFTEFVGIAE